jgi:hypothetical protein
MNVQGQWHGLLGQNHIGAAIDRSLMPTILIAGASITFADGEDAPRLAALDGASNGLGHGTIGFDYPATAPLSGEMPARIVIESVTENYMSGRRYFAADLPLDLNEENVPEGVGSEPVLFVRTEYLDEIERQRTNALGPDNGGAYGKE